MNLNRVEMGFYNHPTSYIFLVCCFFPWVSFGTNDLDMQPWSLLVAVPVLVLNKKIAATESFVIAFFIVAVGLIFSIFKSNSIGFLTARAAYGFLSFFIFFSVFTSLFRRFNMLHLLVKFNVIWWLGAVFEKINPAYMEFFGKVRTSGERGATSFAPEPSFFAAYLIFNSIIIFILSNYEFKKFRWLYALNFLVLIFLTQSAIGLSYILVLCCILLIFNLFRIRPTKLGVIFLILALLTIAITTWFLSTFYNGTRIFDLVFQLAKHGPLYLFKLDASMNERLAHIIFPLHASVDAFFLPHGTDTFSEDRIGLEPFYNGFFWYSMNTDKIMSWIGDWFYTLGLFSIVAFYILFRKIINAPKKVKWTFISVCILLLSAIPVSFPLIPAVLAALCLKELSHHEQRNYREFNA